MSSAIDFSSAEAGGGPAILVADGVGYRNFVLSTQTQPQRVVLTPARLKDFTDFHCGRVTVPDFRENLVTFLLRQTLMYGHMFWTDTTSMQLLRAEPPRGSWKERSAKRLARAAGRHFLSTPARMRAVEGALAFVVRRHDSCDCYRKVLSHAKSSVLFCTHQRSLETLYAVEAARELGIPTATFIFSWDNLTSKGRVAARFDHFLVWSNHMREELLRYYPWIKEDRVHIVGTPQFDPYVRDDILMSRDEFFARMGADPARPLICYSGGDEMTAPEDPDHLRALLTLVRGGAIRGNVQVLLRPAPVDRSNRYDRIKREFPDLLVAQPRWSAVGGDWSQIMPTMHDVAFLANLTRHTDLNINLASTMTLDFAIHDKPVVNIAFDVSDPPIFGKPLADHYYRFEHYRPVIKLGATRLAYSPEELAEHCNLYLADPTLDSDGRRALVDLELGVPVGRSGDAIWRTLEEIASN